MLRFGLVLRSASSSSLSATKSTLLVRTLATATAKPVLTAQQLADYKRDGYVVVRGMFPKETVQNIIKWTQEIQEWPETKGKWMKYFEEVKGERALCRCENFLDFHPGIKGLISGIFNQAASELYGEPTVLFKEKINFKLPGGGGFRPHQDAPAWTTFGQTRHLTAMVAVDAATKENGYLEMVDGEHTKGTYPHIGGELPKDKVAQWKWVPVPLQPGDAVFFHSLTPHRSSGNVSNSPRRAYYLTYNPAADGDYRQAYYDDKRVHFPPEIEREPGKDYSKGGEVYNLANPIANKKIN